MRQETLKNTEGEAVSANFITLKELATIGYAVAFLCSRLEEGYQLDGIAAELDRAQFLAEMKAMRDKLTHILIRDSDPEFIRQTLDAVKQYAEDGTLPDEMTRKPH